MTGKRWEEDDDGGRMGKQLFFFLLFPSTVKVPKSSQQFIPKREQRCKSGPPHVSTVWVRAPTTREN
jgi:hypothetical protein